MSGPRLGLRSRFVSGASGIPVLHRIWPPPNQTLPASSDGVFMQVFVFENNQRSLSHRDVIKGEGWDDDDAYLRFLCGPGPGGRGFGEEGVGHHMGRAA